jgi:hypothetical protein
MLNSYPNGLQAGLPLTGPIRALQGNVGPLAGVLCTILHLKFRENLFHALR